jgi:hypothetical protein
MFDFDRVRVAVLSTSVKRVRNINIAVYIPIILSTRSLITHNGLYRPLILLLGDKSILGVQHSKNEMFLQLNIKPTYRQSLSMRNHVNMKRDLRPEDMRGSGDFDGILTFVGPQILDTLKIRNGHMSEFT